MAACQAHIALGLRSSGVPQGNLQEYNFSDWQLVEQDFSHASLQETQFRRADLRKAKFVEADLLQTDFRDAQLEGADFTKSNVRYAWLHQAKLRKTIFNDTNLEGANFSKLDLSQAQFKRAKLKGANFSNGNLRGADFSKSQLIAVHFSFADLKGAQFIQTNLSGLKLEYLDLSQADFTKADLSNVSFKGSKLTGAKFDQARLAHTSFQQADLRQASFIDSHLTKVDFTQASFAQPNFQGSMIEQGVFANLQMPQANFSHSRFSQSSFKQVNLKGADFSQIKGEVAFMESNLRQTYFNDAELSLGLFRRSQFEPAEFAGMTFPRRTEQYLGLTFIEVPQGCYQMGDLFRETQGFPSKPHPVCLKDYWLAETELTQEQWLTLRKQNLGFNAKNLQKPVDHLTPQEINAFVQEAKSKTGWALRLPSEAEWEYACRQLGRKVRFGNGKNIARPDWMAFNAQATGIAQYSMIKKGRRFHHFGGKWKGPVPVKLFAPNLLGFYDLSGNVEELVADSWNERAYDLLPPQNPTLQGDRLFQVKRGGSWFDGSSALRCSKRSFVQRGEEKATLGFRLAWEGP